MNVIKVLSEGCPSEGMDDQNRLRRDHTLAVSLVLLLILYLGAVQAIRFRLLIQERQIVFDSAQSLGVALQSGITRRLALLEGLGAFVRTEWQEPQIEDEFRFFAFNLRSSASGIRSLSIAPQGVVRYVFPETLNQPARGLDWMKTPTAQRALSRHSWGLDSASDPGLLTAHLPIYKDRAFWGLVSAQIDLKTLTHLAGPADLSSRLSLAVRDPNGQVILGEPSIFDRSPVTTVVYLEEGYWELGAIPVDGWEAAIQPELLTFSLMGVGIMILIAVILVGLFYREDQLLQAVQIRTRQLNEINAALQQELNQRLQVEMELRTSQERLQENQEIFEQFMRYLPGGAFIKDEQRRFVFFNDTLISTFGPDSKNWTGKRIEEVWSSEVAERIRLEDEEILSQASTIQVVDNYQTAADHGRIHLTTKFPIQRPGKPLLIGGIWVDITDRVRAEEQVLHQVSVLEGLYASVQELSRSMDLNERANIIVRTCVEVFGLRVAWLGQALPDGSLHTEVCYPPGALHFEPQESFWNQNPEVQQLVAQLLERLTPIVSSDPYVLPGVQPWHGLFERIRAASFAVYPLSGYETTYSLLLLTSDQKDFFTPERLEFFNTFTRLAASHLENSRLYELRRQQAAELEARVRQRTAQLQEMNAELESFTYTVSHDLRAPLRALQGFALALQEDCAPQLTETGKQYTDRLIASANRMDQLVQDLLAYSRLTRIDLVFKPISLGWAVTEAMDQLEGEIKARQAVVEVRGSLPTLRTHRVILVQILVNLLSNAIRFTAPGVPPQVEVWAEHRPPAWRIWVRDHGIGIAPEDQARIFKVFERLHGIETYPGTGIGLAIVRRGADRLGGRTGVESQPGYGSSFWIDLPDGDLPDGDLPDGDLPDGDLPDGCRNDT